MKLYLLKRHTSYGLEFSLHHANFQDNHIIPLGFTNIIKNIPCKTQWSKY